MFSGLSMKVLNKPIIIGFVADLLFAAKIDDIAERMGYHIFWLERADQIIQIELKVSNAKLTDRIIVTEWILLDQITRMHPALMIFDLSNNMIPWREWLPVLKSASATRRIPVICFGSHVDTQSFQVARSAGADVVLARSRFKADLPGLIQKYSRWPDEKELEKACDQKLSQLAFKGLEQFNRGDYFLAHESLEEAWNIDRTPGRELYRAILQVVVAYLQIERENYPGAVKMFLRLRQWIDPLPDTCRGVNVARLRQDANNVYDALIQLGAARIGEFDRTLFRSVIYDREQSKDPDEGG